MTALNNLKIQLHQHAKKDFKPIFFKIGPGDYAEHDRFIGVPSPTLKKLAKTHAHLSLNDIKILLTSPINEERLLALFILLQNYQKHKNPQEIYDFFMEHLKYINNWNLVDAIAPGIMGAHLFTREKEILTTLANSHDLWERRIAIVSTYYFIKQKDFEWTLKIAKILLEDSHDLIHKAVGWMLREVGKRDQALLEEFLKLHLKKMPRTMLRYAIEKFPEDLRLSYLKS